MARPESVAVGGYYATPEELIPAIAALVRVERDSKHALLDPCAGDGAALVELAKAWFELRKDDCALYACELEATRAGALEQRLWREACAGRREVAKGDAFRLQWSERWGRRGATIAWLNPPYDHDPELGRLEERWLRRFAPALVVGGVLLFLVPFYALAASA